MNAPGNNPAKQVVWWAAAILVLILAAWGWFAVPAHWASLWSDIEFTGWVAPIANRLSLATPVYGDGLRTPMPPLPFVLMHLLFPNGARWVDESLLNYFFQSATVVILYVAFARRLGVVVAFGTALAALPVFFALPKTILYDSMTQFWVAAAGVNAARFIEQLQATSPPDNRTRWRSLIAPSLFVALAMMSKQSTGMGALIGLMGLLIWSPRELTLTTRLRNVVLVLGLVALAMVVLGLLLSPWCSFPGMMRDVWLTGVEVKGGRIRLLLSLGKMILGLLPVLGVFLLGLVVLGACLKRPGFFGPLFHRTPPDDSADRGLPTLAILTFVFALLVGGAVFCVHLIKDAGDLRLLRAGSQLVLKPGLALSLTCIVSMLFPRFMARWVGAETHPLTPFAVVFMGAALFHSLSVDSFRWFYDNNPLIVCAIGLVVLVGTNASRQFFKPASGRGLSLLFVLLVMAAMLPRWLPVAGWVFRCMERWPEVAYLQGARLRAEATELRDLVRLVRSLYQQHPEGGVLLLPSDPNVEAWFDLPRPQLSSAIIFTDQYWDENVNQDFERLSQKPPAIIIVGPRQCWRQFSQVWHKDWGTERLIDLVQERLLRERYVLQGSHQITFHAGQKDWLDVYTLKRDAEKTPDNP